MRLSDGSSLHQLVASGITHPKPPAPSASASAPVAARPLAAAGAADPAEAPAGPAHVYTAERNYLVLRRRAGHWTASWELEDSGHTPTGL